MSFTNVHDLPQALVRAIENDPYSGTTDLKARRVSVTRLIAPPQIVKLQQEHPDIEEDVSERLWSLLGSAVHAIIERASARERNAWVPEGLCGGCHTYYPTKGAPEFMPCQFHQENKAPISEQRLEAEFHFSTDACLNQGAEMHGPWGQCNQCPDPWTIEGAVDHLEAGELIDWKVTSAWSMVYGSKPGGRFEEWEHQLNVYAWLARKNGYTVTGLAVYAILRDHDRKEAGRGSYPALPFQRVGLRLWSDEEVESFIEGRLRDLEQEPVRDCTVEERWAKPGYWKVMWTIGGKCAKRFEDSDPGAMASAVQYAEGCTGATVVHEPGKAPRCESYCPVRSVCPQIKRLPVS